MVEKIRRNIGKNNKTFPVKAIIFDMDGVLLLSAPAHEYAYKKTLEDIGIRNFNYNRFAGMRTDESLKIILNENGINASPEHVNTLAKRKSFLSNIYMKNKVPLAPGCKQILAVLKENYRLALSSSASFENIKLFLHASRCEDIFETVVHGMQVKKAKPEPDIYLLTSMKMKLEPKECLVVEDAVNGVVAAKTAGMFVCGLSGIFTEEELKNAGANVVISDIKDILNELVMVQ